MRQRLWWTNSEKFNPASEYAISNSAEAGLQSSSSALPAMMRVFRQVSLSEQREVSASTLTKEAIGRAAASLAARIGRPSAQ
ncbi:MAG: hypothetical protein LAO76_08255 [Acidobacteriia bacterium]|nr:hypothetical protein [Terriglobia bacterium]